MAFAPEGGVWLVLARAAAVAALLSAFGCAVFQATVLRRLAGAPRLVGLTRASAAAGVVALVAWLAVQAADIAGVSAMPEVALRTGFGHLMLAQAGVLLLVVARPGGMLGLALAGAALALQAGHSHAAAMQVGFSLLLLSDLIHLGAAGAWLGGLLPLLLTVRAVPAERGARVAERFSPLGRICVGLLALTAFYQGWRLIEGVPGLVGTAYGRVALVKLALLLGLLGCAWMNRYRHTPRCRSAGAGGLMRGVALESVIGLGVVVAAACLSQLPPAMHVQPVWPFAARFSLDAVNEDPDLRREVLGAVLGLAGAALLLAIAGIVRSRRSLILVAAAGAIAWLAIPHLDLLWVPAYPTSYDRSPTGFAASSIVAGAALYPGHCAACHGSFGRGDGPAGRGLPVPPADLTAAHLWMHSDGELFWWLAHGIAAPDGRAAMPGFAATLSDDQRWELIDFIRARNAGLGFAATGGFAVPLPAPDLQAVCDGGRSVTLADLRGLPVLLVDGPATARAGVVTVSLAAGATPRPGVCVADDAAIAAGYAIAAGLAPDQMPGARFLIDGAGWLRAVIGRSTHPGPADGALLDSAIRDVRTHRLPAATEMKMGMPANMKM